MSKYIYCKHGGENGHPVILIPVGDDDTFIGLCRQCAGTTLGLLIKDWIFDSQNIKKSLIEAIVLCKH